MFWPVLIGLGAWGISRAGAAALVRPALQSVIFGLGYGASVNLGYNMAYRYTQGGRRPTWYRPLPYRY